MRCVSVASVSKVERKSPAQSRGWKATAAKNGISVPRRLYADFCNKICQTQTLRHLNRFRSRDPTNRESDPMSHRGVAIDDFRNAGITEYFKPEPVTVDSLVRMLTTTTAEGKALTVVRSYAEKAMQRLMHDPASSDPPLSQSLDEVADPWFGLGTHPDIISKMWKMDDALPQKCRWVFCSRPSLVHPDTGVVFAVGFGTIGIVLRLSSEAIEAAGSQLSTVFRRGKQLRACDIGPAGQEWRFILPSAPAAQWCRAAYDFAGADEPR
jgi:hypothetical protein